MKVMLVAAVVAGWVCGGWSMTVMKGEGAALPDELKPIVEGGSFFDDMAIKRLRQKHKELKEIGQLHPHEHVADPEEQFIMARLRDPDFTLVELDQSEEDVPSRPSSRVQSTREVMRSFLRHHTHHDDSESEDLDNSRPRTSVTTSREFMDVYKKELEKFFNNFMSSMLQAEIGGVSIENRSEEERREPHEVFPVDTSGDRSNTVLTP
ncbi:uncharacterized protein LOC121875158 [Homarus americanus]|uniref:uncharacterized protein LOC121875158 n=1 Tax=Homarus americanus TaxID=6706 RepID=UPI001C4528B2|nr:uncharacterized protein LOC121875158 [Homarus americanus]